MNGGNVAILIGVLIVITGITLVGAQVMMAIARICRTIASSKLVPRPAQPSSRWRQLSLAFW